MLALAAVAVGALAAGPLLYRALLPAESAPPSAGCGFFAILGGLFALLVGAAIWQLRRRREPRREELDRRLWEAAIGGGPPAPAAGEPEGGRPEDSRDRPTTG